MSTIENSSSPDYWFDYESLVSAIQSEAVGESSPSEKERITSRDIFDSDGNKTHVVQKATMEKPDIALALKLLDQRIGGPQDYC